MRGSGPWPARDSPSPPTAAQRPRDRHRNVIRIGNPDRRCYLHIFLSFPDQGNPSLRLVRRRLFFTAALPGRAVHYFAAIRSMYDYMNEHQPRARDIFAALFRDDDDPQAPLITPEEHDLVIALRTALNGLTEDDNSEQLEAEADLVYNPLPARIVVHVPGEPLIVEGFAVGKDRELVAEPPSLLEAVASLEGRWVTPDPLAFSTRPNAGSDSDAEAALIAAMPRRTSAVVGAIEVSDAIVQKLRPAPRYRVRWVVKRQE